MEPAFLVAPIEFEYVSAAALAVAAGFGWFAKNQASDKAWEREETRNNAKERQVAWEAVKDSANSQRAFVETGAQLLDYLKKQDEQMNRVLAAVEKLMDNQLRDQQLNRELVAAVLKDMGELKDDCEAIQGGIAELRRTGSGP